MYLQGAIRRLGSTYNYTSPTLNHVSEVCVCVCVCVYLLANSWEALLQSFLLNKRTFNTVHNNIHHLEREETEEEGYMWGQGGSKGDEARMR